LVVVHRTYVSQHAAHCAGGLTAGAHVLGPFADGPLGDVYGSTDAGMPADQPLDEPRRSASCGRVIPESDVRIADEAGRPVGAGAVGEILVRGREHGLVLTDDYGMPEATAADFHDGWFRSGDLGRLDPDRHLYSVSHSTEVAAAAAKTPPPSTSKPASSTTPTSVRAPPSASRAS